MKRIEVKLAVPVVAPLLDVIRALGEAPPVPPPGVIVPPDADPDLRGAWIGDLAAAESTEVRALLAPQLSGEVLAWLERETAAL